MGKAAMAILLALWLGGAGASAQEPLPPMGEPGSTTRQAERAKKAEASAPAPAKSKRQAMLDEGWSEAEVDAHLAGSK